MYRRPIHSQFSQYLAKCQTCSNLTNKKYAREHGGQCKSCVTGEDQTTGAKCPQCGERNLSAYQRAHHYVCDACTRENDPIGYANEVRGFYD